MTSPKQDHDKQALATEIEQQLCQFTGTGAYYRLSRKHLMTDGAKYLADRAQCYWMMDAIVSHLCEIGTNDWFVHVHMKVTRQHALMVYDDGNWPARPLPIPTSPSPRSPCTPAGTASTGSSCCPRSTEHGTRTGA